MKKIVFSLKKLKIGTAVFVVISLVNTLFWVVFVVFLLNILTSYTKGASLLTSYTKEYFLNLHYPNAFEEGFREELEMKIEGFHTFYELLIHQQRSYKEIEKIWTEFGMKKEEVPLVVYGTMMMRDLPMMETIKTSAQKLKEKIDLARTGKVTTKDITEISLILSEFHNSFYSAINSITYISLFIASFLALITLVSFSYFVLKQVSPLSAAVKVTSKHILSVLKKETYEKIDLIDPRSDLAVIQESVNSLAEKLSNMERVKGKILDKILSISSFLEQKIEALAPYTSYIASLKESILNLDVNFVSNEWESFKRSFSIIDSEIKRIYESFEKFRNLSSGIFEPISSVYDIIEKTFSQYSLTRDVSLKYISETRNMVDAIQLSLEKSTESIGYVLSDLKRISSNLRSLGINASIEFSKFSSESEALSGIATKIVNLSRGLGELFSNMRTSIEEFKIEITQSLTKVRGFIDSFSEMEKTLDEISSTVLTLLNEKKTVESNISSAYTVIAESITSMSSIKGESEKLLMVFYQLEKRFGGLLDFVSSIVSLFREADIVLAMTEELKSLLFGLKAMSEELQKI